MWKLLLGTAGKGLKSVATGSAQSQLGIQSPHLPAMVVRVGRFFYITFASWIGITWYTAYVNERTQPGSGPSLILPRTRPVIGAPDRPEKTPKFAKNISSSTAAGSNIPGSGSGQKLPGGGQAGGFLPAGAMYKVGRRDQGQDGQTNPGGPIIAPGSGTVLTIGYDPNGFGPNYPIVKFTTGPDAGRIIYIGHTHSALPAGAHFSANQILSYTGKTGATVGNASVPGWFEIGYADSGSPGPFGQAVPF